MKDKKKVNRESQASIEMGGKNTASVFIYNH